MLYDKETIIELVHDTGLSAEAGATAKLTQPYYKGESYVRVKWIRNELSKRQMDGGYGFRDFKVIIGKVSKKWDEILNLK